MIFVNYVRWLVENPVVEDLRGRERGDQGMMSQHFRGEKSLEELVTLTHQNLPLST